jgi:hypothetical protein
MATHGLVPPVQPEPERASRRHASVNPDKDRSLRGKARIRARKRPGDGNVINPLTEKPLRSESAEFVTKLREARSGARRAARSGHPAKRAEARRALTDIPGVIRATYMKEASR